MGVEFKDNASSKGLDQLHGGTDNKAGDEWSKEAIDFADKELGEVDLGEGKKGTVKDLFDKDGKVKDEDAANTLNNIVDTQNGDDNIWGEGDDDKGGKEGLKGYLERHKNDKEDAADDLKQKMEGAGGGGFEVGKVGEDGTIPEEEKKALSEHGLTDELMEKSGITKDGKMTKEGREFMDTLSDKNGEGKSEGFGATVFDAEKGGILNSEKLGANPEERLKKAMELAKKGEETAKTDDSRAGRDTLYEELGAWGTKKEREAGGGEAGGGMLSNKEDDKK